MIVYLLVTFSKSIQILSPKVSTLFGSFYFVPQTFVVLVLSPLFLFYHVISNLSNCIYLLNISFKSTSIKDTNSNYRFYRFFIAWQEKLSSWWYSFNVAIQDLVIRHLLVLFYCKNQIFYLYNYCTNYILSFYTCVFFSS